MSERIWELREIARTQGEAGLADECSKILQRSIRDRLTDTEGLTPFIDLVGPPPHEVDPDLELLISDVRAAVQVLDHAAPTHAGNTAYAKALAYVRANAEQIARALARCA